MPNIQLFAAEQAPLLAKPYFGEGDVSPIVAALAQVPEFLTVGLPFIGSVLGDWSICERWK